MLNIAPRTVLVVDDDKAVRQVLRSALERFDYRVVESADGADALAVLDADELTVSAIVTDVDLPRVDGVALVEGLVERCAEVPVILTSGCRLESTLPAGVRSRVAEFIAKPFTLRDLLSAVERVTR